MNIKKKSQLDGTMMTKVQHFEKTWTLWCWEDLDGFQAAIFIAHVKNKVDQVNDILNIFALWPWRIVVDEP